jgi:hypoxanthine phosphoribosyltransferase
VGLTAQQAWEVLETAEQICSAAAVSEAVERIAREVSAVLKDANPLVLGVMRGSVVFAGALLPRLRFPLEFDYLEVTRYRSGTQGGELAWRVSPGTEVGGRVVLVIDDILDEGHTLAAIRDRLLEVGARKFLSAVLADKDIGRDKPIRADFVGVRVPDRYVFGFGMDVRGVWRNLPAIYAVRADAG